MVTIAQLAERRIVVPKVVGSSPTSHPKSLDMTEIEKRWEALGFTKELQGEVKENIVKLFESEAKRLLDEPKENNEVNEATPLPIVLKVYAKTMGDAPKTPMK